MFNLPDIAILGAGPIGIECAIYAKSLGFPTTVLEKHSGPAGNVETWQDVDLFTPFEMNSSSLGRQLLGSESVLPLNNEHSGQAWINQYLRPLTETSLLADTIKYGVVVESVSRLTYSKTDGLGTVERQSDPFKICYSKLGKTRLQTCDVVIDATGTFGFPNPIGTAGSDIKWLEREKGRAVCSSEHIDQIGLTFGIVSPRMAEKAFAQKKVLLIGNGYSAATNLANMASFVDDNEIRLTWLVKQKSPIESIDDDSLPARQKLTAKANTLANLIDFQPNQIVYQIRPGSERRFSVDIIEKSTKQIRSSEFDFVIANVGFQGNFQMLDDLQLHRCYATGGPMKLAASLLSQKSADCLAISSDASTIVTTEPNFFIIGSKSYGRNSSFLFQNGLSQIRDLFQQLTNDHTLDLYKTARSHS